MVSKLLTFFRYPNFVKIWVVPVWLGLGIAKATIVTVSFRRLAPRLGNAVGVAPWVPIIDEAQQKRARLIGQVIRLASRYTPWDSNCFPQAIIAKAMLAAYRVPYCLFFGLYRNAATGAFDAHAWVVAGRVKVIGGWAFDKYTVVGVFSSPQLTRNISE